MTARFGLLWLAGAGLGLAAVGAANWFVDPANLFANRAYGRGFAVVFDEACRARAFGVEVMPNYDERDFNRAVIARMTAAPDVVVLGSSRAMDIGGALWPGRRVWNAGVSGASLEDHMGLLELLERRDLRPGTVVFGLDPWLLNAASHQNRWRTLAAEHAAFAARVGAPATPVESTDAGMAPAYTLAWVQRLVSLSYFQGAVAFWRNGWLSWRTGRVLADDRATDSHVKRCDGSHGYPRAILERAPALVRQAALWEGAGAAPYSLADFSELDPARVRQLEATVGFQAKRGTEIVFVLPPYHPETWRLLNQRPDMARLIEAEAYFRALAARHGIEVRGSYDPARAGCAAEEFTDALHARPGCIARIVAGPRRD